LAGLVISWMPLNLFPVAFLPGTYIFLGYLFSGLIIATALGALLLPAASTYLGILVILFSILSIFGALGGLIVGAIMGIAGGSLIVAWRPPRPAGKAAGDGSAAAATAGSSTGAGGAGTAAVSVAGAGVAGPAFRACDLVTEEELRRRPWLKF